MCLARQKGDKDALRHLMVSWGQLEHKHIISTRCLSALASLPTGCYGNTEREQFTSLQFGEIWRNSPPDLRCERCVEIDQTRGEDGQLHSSKGIYPLM